jgi:heme oxygenase
MAAGTLSLEAYVAQLQAYLAIYLCIEKAALRSPDRRVAVAFRDDMRKSSLLAGDLAALERVPRLLPPAPEGELGGYLDALAEAAEDGAALLGHVYVFEGSTLGSAILLPRLVASLGLSEGEHGYYSGYGPATYEHWEAFKGRMNDALPDEPSQALAVSAARRAFDGLRAIFEQIEGAERAARIAPPAARPAGRSYPPRPLPGPADAAGAR